MRFPSILLLIASALLTGACTPSGAPDTRAVEEAAIRALDEQWSAAAGRNDLAATLAHYSDDAVVLPANGPIAKDAKAIRDSWAGLLGPNTAISWKATKVEVARSGDLGYLYGTYELTIKDPKGGPPVHDVGKLVEIWKKQADGKWKCSLDTYNSDIPLPPPPDAKKK